MKIKKQNLDFISNHGFSLAERGGRVTDFALISLRTGLKSYFSTYSSTKNIFLFNPNNSAPPTITDPKHSLEYTESSAETILHIQHFSELVCKDLLRDEHPLLATDASNNPTILSKLINNEPITDQEQDKLKNLEFSTPLKRLVKLQKDGRITKNNADFVTTSQQALEVLNTLRNRLLHRGKYVLRHDALDQLIGGYILPFIQAATALPKYAPLTSIWKYPSLHCGIDPMTEIEKELKNPSFDWGKVAFLKELGRAAYKNPIRKISMLEYHNETYKRRAEAAASTDEYNVHSSVYNVHSVIECPVCGVNSLVIYEETELEGADPETGSFEKAYHHTREVKCMCCTFSINRYIKNPKDYGFQINDFWI